jgi:DNA invertase Pin-like site-specific DNA recombinase
MLIGYARVSTQDQSLSAQVDALQACGCRTVFEEKASGSYVDRPVLATALSQLGVGDTLVVWKIDRLGRTVAGVVNLVEALHSRGVHFRSLTDALDTSGAQGKFFFHVMAAFAEMERDLIRERTRLGLESARKRGRVGGRPRALSDAQMKLASDLLKSGKPAREVADVLKISLPTLYRWCPAHRSS